MKKRIIYIALVVIIALSGLIFFLTRDNPSKDALNSIKDLDSYLLEGEMEIVKGEDIKTYIIQVGYKKDKKELFKVSLFDKDLNQEQILLANNKGVYVITPALNQSFKFSGGWPLDSPKPYLLQSIYNIISSDDTEVIKDDELIRFKSKVNYPTNKSYDRQEVLFKDGVLSKVEIFNKGNTNILNINFRKVKYNNEFDKDFFKVDSTSKAVLSGKVTFEDLPYYPALTYNSSLESREVIGSGDDKTYVLKYSGDSNFTIIQSVARANDTFTSITSNGSLIDDVDVIASVDEQSITTVYNNMEITLYSDDLTSEEMLSVIASLQIVSMK